MNDEDIILVLRYINSVRYLCDLKLLAQIPKGIPPSLLQA